VTRAPAEVGSAANSYEILAKLAMGGMAEIFLARGASAAGVERYVVLKRVLRHRASDVHFVQMFLDEARLAAQLQHPNIAQVYDIGKLGDSYFFTMEYVHGETVRSLLARSHGLRRQIPISSVLSIMAGASAGLHHAHDRKGFDGRHLGIVHRDVSPSNLMVSYEGTVKVVDFGVAKAAHRSTETLSGTVKGKISYMSPEQCKGAAEIDRRSDLFSLGIVMWEMLTTEKLFRRTSDFETMQAIVSDTVPPPSQLRPDVPPDVDHVVGKLLAKDPAQRYQTADELHEAIETVAVRTGSALSTASLGRYMRELFGQRPEPWIELATAEQHPEAFTVTSEPIPNNLALSPAEEFDRKLSAVPALTQRLTTQQEGARPPQPTVPLRIGPELVTTLPIEPDDFNKTQPIRDSAPRVRNVVELPVDRRAPSQPPANQSGSHPGSAANQSGSHPGHASGPMQRPPMFTPDSGLLVPQATPHSSPQYPIATSASHQAFGHQPSYAVTQRAKQPTTVSRSRALIIVVPAIVIGVVIGVALGFGGSKDTAAVAKADKPTPEANTTTTMVATPDKAAAPASVADVKPEPAATPVAEVKPEAAATIAKPATVAQTETTLIAMPDDEVEQAPAKPVEVKPDIVALYKTAKYSEVVTTCSSSGRLAAANATQCTLAACRVKQASKAKRWFKLIGDAKKAAVIEQCDGIVADKPVEKPVVVDPCKVDPMACQH
jgi:eukaryotic-like serine/threonine-protein kinase